MLRIEVAIVDAAVIGDIQLALDKGTVDDYLRSFVRNPRCSPSFDVFLHRLEVPLNSADSIESRIMRNRRSGNCFGLPTSGLPRTDLSTSDN
jgi:hypothetical protein